MHFRHEWKHLIGPADLLALRARLSAVMLRDHHAADGSYQVRSLYFDNLADKALREKIDSVNCREKFRIRYYGQDISRILLEKKSKINGLCSKSQTCLTTSEAQAAACGDLQTLANAENPLLQELYRKMTIQGLRPKTIVDYTREPFIYPPGNVRVTLDHHIRTALSCLDFLDPDSLTIPVRDMPIILEVKWDEFLPAVIRDIVQTPGVRTTAFSKYAACRIYG